MSASIMDEPQIMTVDNWHPKWDQVLALIRKTGGLHALDLSDKGWLSARHSLLVAFMSGVPVGYVSIRIAPATGSDGHLAYDHGRPMTEARIDCRGRESFADASVEFVLLGQAVRRAVELHCRGLVDEKGAPVVVGDDGPMEGIYGRDI